MHRNVIAICLCALALAACAAQPPPGAAGSPPGFLLALVHGFISPFSLIGSIFWDVRVYAYPNTGFWYELGFVFGAAFLFGGGSISVKFGRR